MTKKQRLDKILFLIKEYELSTQEELTNKLNEFGFNVSQATVSRDINELGLIKAEGVNKKIKYVECTVNKNDVSEKNVTLFKHVTVSITYANNLVIVKTLSGSASSVGATIDEMNLQQVLGTISGDDTLLIVTKTEKDAEILVKTLRSL